LVKRDRGTVLFCHFLTDFTSDTCDSYFGAEIPARVNCSKCICGVLGS